MIDIGAKAWIALAGPVAQAMLTEIEDADDPFIGWSDHLLGAVLDGGQADAGDALGLIDDPRSVDIARHDLDRNWEQVIALAGQLVDRGTVPGAEAFAVLDPAGAFRKREILLDLRR